MMIQLRWNVIIKALRGAESSKNRTSTGEQSKLSLPPGYFTYLQPKQLKPPTTFSLAQPICCFCFSEHRVGVEHAEGCIGVDLAEEWENDRRR